MALCLPPLLNFTNTAMALCLPPLLNFTNTAMALCLPPLLNFTNRKLALCLPHLLNFTNRKFNCYGLIATTVHKDIFHIGVGTGGQPHFLARYVAGIVLHKKILDGIFGTLALSSPSLTLPKGSATRDYSSPSLLWLYKFQLKFPPPPPPPSPAFTELPTPLLHSPILEILPVGGRQTVSELKGQTMHQN